MSWISLGFEDSSLMVGNKPLTVSHIVVTSEDGTRITVYALSNGVWTRHRSTLPADMLLQTLKDLKAASTEW